MRDKPLHDLVHTELLVPRLRSKLAEKHLVVPVVRALEHLVNLVCRLVRLEALLDDVRGEFELAEAHEVTRNKVQYLVVAQITFQLEHILYQIVAKGVFNQEVDPTNNDICKGQFLLHQAFLKATLHDATSVLVRADLIAVGHARAVDKLGVGGVLLGPWQVQLLRLVARLERQ